MNAPPRMNPKYFNSALIAAIVLTLIAVFMQPYLPKKQLLVIPNNNPHFNQYLYSIDLPNSGPAAIWVNKQEREWMCIYLALKEPVYNACSYNQMLTDNPEKGVDLSEYNHLKIILHNSGKVPRVRVSIRNFNPAYSVKTNDNSFKFNAVALENEEINNDLDIKLNEFSVSDWWLEELKIPHKYSHPELTNAVMLGVDFVDILPPGNYTVRVERAEFIGDWISPANWYLFILSVWLLGVFCYAFYQLLIFHYRTREHNRKLRELSNVNESLKVETDKLRKLSTVDALTQTYNRFGIDQILNQLSERALSFQDTQTDAPDFSIILLDIDHFKPVNDTRGHDVGDRVLQEMAKIIQSNIRSLDYVGRWGGEEFIIILPGTRKEFAHSLSEKMRSIIMENIFEPENPLHLTASFGICDHFQGEDFSITFKRADIALYKAKKQGRNCCIMAEDK